jgi:hypothetical protein
VQLLSDAELDARADAAFVHVLARLAVSGSC